jgi:DNA-binding PadR family transcriptional regulator
MRMATHKSAGLGSFPLEIAALGLLVMEPKHGYRLYREFVTEFHLIWKGGQANFYAALSGLEAHGQIVASAQPQPGRPPRKVYQITRAGRETFLTWLHAPVQSMRAFRVEFIAKLRFFALLDLPGERALIEQQIDLLRGLLGEWEEQTSLADSNPVAAMISDFRTRQAEMIIDWLVAWREHFVYQTPVA